MGTLLAIMPFGENSRENAPGEKCHCSEKSGEQRWTLHVATHERRQAALSLGSNIV